MAKENLLLRKRNNDIENEVLYEEYIDIDIVCMLNIGDNNKVYPKLVTEVENVKDLVEEVNNEMFF